MTVFLGPVVAGDDLKHSCINNNNNKLILDQLSILLLICCMVQGIHNTRQKYLEINLLEEVNHELR